MKIVICILFLLLASVIDFGNCTPLEPRKDLPNYECVNGAYHLPKEFQKKIETTCKNPKIYGLLEGKKHPNCITLCITEMFGCLGDDGLPNVDCQEKFIREKVPAQYADMAVKNLRDCSAKHSKNLDPNDPTCSAIAAYSKCVYQIQPKLRC